ncbi:hypothetical protein BV898_07653 [Hypsibius exemplaris]|uniref:RRM domain-containing protein n=1 Tax=Hypsibius exemplaris TaxID=2072580 RepID=A0A1W0WSV5_HYPEX|nr:hypothetical protein BV898_07653 [Hypsibius exemplaris]
MLKAGCAQLFRNVIPPTAIVIFHHFHVVNVLESSGAEGSPVRMSKLEMNFGRQRQASAVDSDEQQDHSTTSTAEVYSTPGGCWEPVPEPLPEPLPKLLPKPLPEPLPFSSMMVKVYGLPYNWSVEEIERLLLNVEFAKWSFVTVHKIIPITKPFKSHFAIVKMGCREDAKEAVRAFIHNAANSRALQRDWRRQLRLELAEPEGFQPDSPSVIFYSPDVERSSSKFSFATARSTSPTMEMLDANRLRSSTSKVARLDSLGVPSQHGGSFPATSTPPASSAVPPPVELYIKQGDQFRLVGRFEADLLSQLSLNSSASLPRTHSTAKFQQQATATVTRTVEASLNDTLHETSYMSSLSQQQRTGTPKPGFEESPYREYFQDVSPVANKSPLTTKKTFTRQFSFTETNEVNGPSRGGGAPPPPSSSSLREQFSDSADSTCDLTFHSELPSLRAIRASPEWLPKTTSEVPPSPQPYGAFHSSSSAGHYRYAKDAQPSFAGTITPPRRQPGESAPRVAPSVFLEDLKTALLQMRSRHELKLLAVLDADLLIFESPLVMDDPDNSIAIKLESRVDSFCRRMRLAEPFSPKLHEVFMVKHGHGVWDFGLYQGPTVNRSPTDFAKILFLNSDQAGQSITVGVDDLRPVPSYLFTDLDMPFIVARLHDVTFPRSRKEKLAMTRYLQQWLGRTVRVVTRAHDEHCNEVEVSVMLDGKMRSLNRYIRDDINEQFGGAQ